MKTDLPQGTLDLLILKIVALGPVHGYAIAQRLQQVSRDVVQVPQGSLYPALHRLENRDLLTADWKATDTGREAKFYRLTRKGRAMLEAETASWRRLSDAIGLIRRLSEGGAEWPGGIACGTGRSWSSSSRRSCGSTSTSTRPSSSSEGLTPLKPGGVRGSPWAARSR